MAKGIRIMRRVPEDIEEARRIHGLIKANLEAKVLELSQAGKLNELHILLGDEKRWAGIVADLTAPEVGKPQPAAKDPNPFSGAPEPPASVSPDKAEGGEAPATLTGGTRNRGARAQ